MKIELVKEKAIDGKFLYWVKVNDSYKKCFFELPAAEDYYQLVVSNGNTNVSTVLKSTEI
jgi:hypothetical protein